jgi:hypothetical protein
MTIAWIQVFLGVWMILSPWMFGSDTNAVLFWSNVIAGLAVALLSVWELFGREK